MLDPDRCMIPESLIPLGTPATAAALVLRTLNGIRPHDGVSGVAGSHRLDRGDEPGALAASPYRS